MLVVLTSIFPPKRLLLAYVWGFPVVCDVILRGLRFPVVCDPARVGLHFLLQLLWP